MGNGSSGSRPSSASSSIKPSGEQHHHHRSSSASVSSSSRRGDYASWSHNNDQPLSQLPLISSDYLSTYLESHVTVLSQLPSALLIIIGEYARHVHQLAAVFTDRRRKDDAPLPGLYVFPALTPDDALGATHDGFDVATPNILSSIAVPRAAKYHTWRRTNIAHQLVAPTILRRDDSLIICDIRAPDGILRLLRYSLANDIWCDHVEQPSLSCMTLNGANSDGNRLASVSLVSGRLVFGDAAQRYITTREPCATWLDHPPSSSLSSSSSSTASLSPKKSRGVMPTITDEWSLPPTLGLTNKRSLMSVSHHGRLYLLDRVSRRGELFDPMLGTWSTFESPSFPLAGVRLVSTSTHGILGVVHHGGVKETTIHCLNTQTMTWHRVWYASLRHMSVYGVYVVDTCIIMIAYQSVPHECYSQYMCRFHDRQHLIATDTPLRDDGTPHVAEWKLLRTFSNELDFRCAIVC